MVLCRAGTGPCPSDRFDDHAVRILGERLYSGGAHVAEALRLQRGRLDGLVRATSNDLQAAMALIEAARGRMRQ